MLRIEAAQVLRSTKLTEEGEAFSCYWFVITILSISSLMAFDNTLLRELERGGYRFEGSEIDFQIPISDSFVGRMSTHPQITFLAANRVQIKHKVKIVVEVPVTITAKIDEWVDMNNERIRITIEGFAGKAANVFGNLVNLPFLHIQGPIVYLLLNRIPQLQPVLRHKRFIHSIRLQTIQPYILIIGKIRYPYVLPPR